MEKLFIAADHAGKALKDFLCNNLKEYSVENLGTNLLEPMDYPDLAKQLCEKIKEGNAKGILICGSGIGMSIAANKCTGIRAAHVESLLTARLAGEHNRANVLCLGERITAPHHALEISRAWLTAEFGGKGDDEAAKSRHQRRIDKIHDLERESH